MKFEDKKKLDRKTFELYLKDKTSNEYKESLYETIKETVNYMSYKSNKNLEISNSAFISFLKKNLKNDIDFGYFIGVVRRTISYEFSIDSITKRPLSISTSAYFSRKFKNPKALNLFESSQGVELKEESEEIDRIDEWDKVEEKIIKEERIKFIKKILSNLTKEEKIVFYEKIVNKLSNEKIVKKHFNGKFKPRQLEYILKKSKDKIKKKIEGGSYERKAFL
jgi:hypothetical protein